MQFSVRVSAREAIVYTKTDLPPDPLSPRMPGYRPIHVLPQAGPHGASSNLGLIPTALTQATLDRTPSRLQPREKLGFSGSEDAMVRDVPSVRQQAA